MPRIRRTQESRRDYQDINRFIAEHDPSAADRLLRHFDARLTILADSHFAARKVDELAPGLRCSPVGSYCLFYRPIADGIELIRALHVRRDILPKLFSAK